MNMHGYFEKGRIYIDVEVWGILQKLKQNFKALVDTGFDGYITIPFAQALSLGLVLKGTQSYTLADGKSSHNLVCLGTVKYHNKKAVVPIDVQFGASVLIGSSLLKELGIGLNADYKNQEVKFRNCKVKPTTNPVTTPSTTA